MPGHASASAAIADLRRKLGLDRERLKFWRMSGMNAFLT
jgi:hypothetical protein